MSENDPCLWTILRAIGEEEGIPEFDKTCLNFIDYCHVVRLVYYYDTVSQIHAILDWERLPIGIERATYLIHTGGLYGK